MGTKNSLRKALKKDIIFTYPLIILLILITIDIGLIVHQLNIPIFQISKALMTNPQAVRDYISSFGVWAPAVFLLMQTLQVVISPIPGNVTALVGGLMFGTLYGTILTIIGSFFGSLIAFKISQKFGRTLIEKIAGKTDFNFFDDFFEQKGPYAVFVLRLIPIMAFDIISYGMGLTKISFKDYATATFFGMIPGIVLYSYLGSHFALNPIIVLISSVAAILLLLLLPALKSYFISKKKLEKRKKK